MAIHSSVTYTFPSLLRISPPLHLSVAGCSYRFDVSSSNTSENEDIVEDNCPANCGGIIRFYKRFGKNVRGARPGYFENLWELPIKIHQVAGTPKESENLKSFQCESNFVSPKTAEYKLFTLFFKMYKTECKMCCNYIPTTFLMKNFSQRGCKEVFRVRS